MDVPIWAWVAAVAVILGMLALDLFVFHRQAHEVTMREAATTSAVWITLGLAFAGVDRDRDRPEAPSRPRQPEGDRQPDEEDVGAEREVELGGDGERPVEQDPRQHEVERLVRVAPLFHRGQEPAEERGPPEIGRASCRERV